MYGSRFISSTSYEVEKSRTVLIPILPISVTESDIAKAFSGYGQISKMTLRLSPTGVHCSAVITFETKIQAMNIISQFNRIENLFAKQEGPLTIRPQYVADEPKFAIVRSGELERWTPLRRSSMSTDITLDLTTKALNGLDFNLEEYLLDSSEEGSEHDDVDELVDAESLVIDHEPDVWYEVLEKRCKTICSPLEEGTCVEGSLIVKNLDPDVTTLELRRLFGKLGLITSIILSLDDKNLGVALITFADEKKTSLAVNQLNNTKLRTRYIQLFGQRNKKKGLVAAIVKMENLPPSMTQEDLAKSLKSYGKILSSYLAVNRNGESKCWGCVQFVRKLDAWKCVDTWSHPTIRVNILFSERIKSSICLSQLPKTVTEIEIRQVIAKFGTIKHFFLGESCSGWNYSFVCMSTRQEAQKAAISLKGQYDVFIGQVGKLHCAMCRRDISQWRRMEEEDHNDEDKSDENATVKPAGENQ